MIEAKLISPSDLTDEDIFWLIKGCAGAWDKATAKDQVQAAVEGRAGIYRLSGDVQGCFVLSVGSQKDKELMITALGGKGFIKHFKAVYNKIKATAASAGARRLSGFVSREGLAALYRNRTLSKPVATLFVEDFQ